VFVAVCLLVGVLGLGVRREWLRSLRRTRPDYSTAARDLRSVSLQVWLAIVAIAGFAVYAGYGFAAAGVKPLSEWDSWSIWGRKATALFYDGSLPVHMFTSPIYAFMHPDYPILVPTFESIQFRAMGGLNTQPLHAQFWLLLVTFVWSVLYLGARRGALLTWTPIAVAIGIAPGVYGQLMTAYADIPMAIFLALGVLLLAEWLRTFDGRVLALATLFLAASANTKNEGLLVAVIAFVVAGGVLAATRRTDRIRLLALGALGFLAGILPWRLWVAAHHLQGEIPFGKAFSLSYLADRSDRFWPSVTALYEQLIDQTTWLYIVPLAAALVVASFAARRRRETAAFFFGTGVLFFIGLVWVYWVSSVEPLKIFLATSAYRVVAAIMAISLAALLEFTAPERPSEAEG
jgi:hypothetical protein